MSPVQPVTLIGNLMLPTALPTKPRILAILACAETPCRVKPGQRRGHG